MDNVFSSGKEDWQPTYNELKKFTYSRDQSVTLQNKDNLSNSLCWHTLHNSHHRQNCSLHCWFRHCKNHLILIPVDHHRIVNSIYNQHTSVCWQYLHNNHLHHSCILRYLHDHDNNHYWHCQGFHSLKIKIKCGFHIV